MRHLIASAVVLGLGGHSFANTWTVDDDGPADFDNIQAAVDAASDGDEIVVLPGVYTSTQDEHVVAILSKEVSLRSSDGSDVTFIDGEGVRRGLLCHFVSSKTVIEGFTITGGDASNGGGIQCYGSSPTITGCMISDNTGINGGGIFCSAGGNPTITDCTISDNTGLHGGGIYINNSDVAITDCMISDNTATDDGGGISGYVFILHNTTVCGNSPNQISGGYSDEGKNTVAAVCPSPGACCTNGECMIAEQADCLAFHGTWLGEGTTCDDSPCPTSCLGDVTGDGQVNVADLLTVIANWNNCP